MNFRGGLPPASTMGGGVSAANARGIAGDLLNGLPGLRYVIWDPTTNLADRPNR
jgi:hypothetical protein